MPSQSFRFGEPCGCGGVAGHTPVAAGREGDTADLDSVGHAVTLELLAEEAAAECDEPFLDRFAVEIVLKRLAGEEIYLGRREAVAEHIIKEKSCSA